LISSVQGTVESYGPDWVDLSVGGVTLRVNVPASTPEQLGETRGRVRLYTSLQVREDSLTLFGFLTQEARATFGALIGINGVGPRLALSVLSQFTPEGLAAAVGAGDVDAFTGVPGVGKKTAGRIVLELRGKLGDDWAIGGVGASGDQAELVQALTSLGYSSAEAREAAMAVPTGDEVPLEEKVRIALQRITGNA
jgi:Holliday junction DNA helicase RuvA